MAGRRYWLLSALLVLAGLGVSILWILASGGLESLQSLTRVSFVEGGGLLMLTSGHLGIRFLRWQFLLRRSGIRLPIRPSLRSYLASLVGIATPAYAGEVLRCAFARRNHGAPLPATLTILLLERFLDVAALGLLGVVFAAGGTERTALVVIAGAAVALAVGIAILARFALPASAHPSRLWELGTFAPAFAASVAAWCLGAATVTLAARAVGESLPFQEGARVFCQSTLLGGLTLLPAGLGVTGSAALYELRNLGLTTQAALPVVALFRWTTTGFALSIGVVFLVIEFATRRRHMAADPVKHFDEIALAYERQYAPHVWRLVLERKVGFLSKALEEPPAKTGIGLDFGCGLGHQCAEMRARGYRVVGVDPSWPLLRHASERRVPVVVGDGLALPFRDESLDYVYAIGVLHHMPNREAQEAACREVARVLKPGGRFLVVETNTRNPLFRFYMGYVFPLLKSIDEGTELWIDPRGLGRQCGFESLDTHYFTFVPDTIPRGLLPLLLAIERRLEASALRPYAAHYLAVLGKPKGRGAVLHLRQGGSP